MTELQGKAGIGSGSGQYVWKKTGDVSFTIENYGNTGLKIINANGFDPSNIDANFFGGFSGGTFAAYGHNYEVTFLEGAKVEINDITVSSAGQADILYDASSKIITIVGQTEMNLWVFTNSIFAKQNYVVSNDKNAYPDGDKQDDCWYELISQPVDLADETDLVSNNIRSGINIFGVIGAMVDGISPSSMGFSKVECGVYTPTSTAYYISSINHSLGTTPKMVIMYDKNMVNNSDGFAFMVGFSSQSNGYEVIYRNTSGGVSATVENNTTYRYLKPYSTYFTVRTSYSGSSNATDFIAGRNYYWIALA
jgi:hypothetical protein